MRPVDKVYGFTFDEAPWGRRFPEVLRPPIMNVPLPFRPASFGCAFPAQPTVPAGVMGDGAAPSREGRGRTPGGLEWGARVVLPLPVVAGKAVPLSSRRTRDRRRGRLTRSYGERPPGLPLLRRLRAKARTTRPLCPSKPGAWRTGAGRLRTGGGALLCLRFHCGWREGKPGLPTQSSPAQLSRSHKRACRRITSHRASLDGLFRESCLPRSVRRDSPPNGWTETLHPGSEAGEARKCCASSSAFLARYRRVRPSLSRIAQIVPTRQLHQDRMLSSAEPIGISNSQTVLADATLGDGPRLLVESAKGQRKIAEASIAVSACQVELSPQRRNDPNEAELVDDKMLNVRHAGGRNGDFYPGGTAEKRNWKRSRGTFSRKDVTRKRKKDRVPGRRACSFSGFRNLESQFRIRHEKAQKLVPPIPPTPSGTRKNEAPTHAATSQRDLPHRLLIRQPLRRGRPPKYSLGKRCFNGAARARTQLPQWGRSQMRAERFEGDSFTPSMNQLQWSGPVWPIRTFCARGSLFLPDCCEEIVDQCVRVVDSCFHHSRDERPDLVEASKIFRSFQNPKRPYKCNPDQFRGSSSGAVIEQCGYSRKSGVLEHLGFACAQRNGRRWTVLERRGIYEVEPVTTDYGRLSRSCCNPSSALRYDFPVNGGYDEDLATGFAEKIEPINCRERGKDGSVGDGAIHHGRSCEATGMSIPFPH